MYTIQELEKQQIGLRLPQYLIDDIDAFTQQFSVNRTDIVIEALRSYLAEQKAKIFYTNFDNSCKEAKAIMDGELPATTLGELIDELETDSNA
ncbi:MAG: Unknown protein [uncultured Sulfurovum sp.]|uniref:CopG family transcriptional regulator n=1 Tax=uncultured Sulfurovum sp. TaxID=269237 RepID=A0A6S6SL20_9BACT|nr:MAG: Unknown protein [uncultured Sulfurovum sp.]